MTGIAIHNSSKFLQGNLEDVGASFLDIFLYG